MTPLFGSCVEILPTARTGSDPADNYWRTLDGLAEDGMAIEFWPTGTDWTPYTPRHLATLRRACQNASRISIHGVVPGWQPDALRREFDVCNAVGATILVLHSHSLGLGKSGQADIEEIRSIIREASRRGITIALENCPESPEVFSAMVDGVCSESDDSNLAVCLDVGHTCFITGSPQGPGHYIGKLPRGTIQHTHLHDIQNIGKTLFPKDHQIPGSGELDWHHLFRALQAAEYDGVYLIELNHPAQPLEMIRQSHRFLRQVYQELGADYPKDSMEGQMNGQDLLPAQEKHR